MKSDRRHFKRPREPLARGDTSSESITQVTCHSWQWRGLPTQSRSHPERSEGSITLNQILRPEKAGLRMTDSLSGNPPLSKPPTGFSESDEVNRRIWNAISGERWTNLHHLSWKELGSQMKKSVKNNCLIMDSKRLWLCQN